MLTQIKGLHHVTSLANGAKQNNDFFTQALGLRRVKKTVNFDRPDVYHLYYGDKTGSPGSVMTYFPFPGAKRGTQGLGEVARTQFAVPDGSTEAWANRFGQLGVTGLTTVERFGEKQLDFDAPDGDKFSLVETFDKRCPWTKGGIPKETAIRGFHGATLRVGDIGATRELLHFMGYETAEQDGNITRFVLPQGGPANLLDVDVSPEAPDAEQGAGSVHHIAFAVETRARQLEVREALLDTGYQVTPVIDRDYFYAIYFRTPDGILFEISTNEPGFDRDEDTKALGQALKLPAQHAHLRSKLERTLEPIDS